MSLKLKFLPKVLAYAAAAIVTIYSLAVVV